MGKDGYILRNLYKNTTNLIIVIQRLKNVHEEAPMGT